MRLSDLFQDLRDDLAIDRSMNRRSHSWSDVIRLFVVPQLACLVIYRISRLLYLKRMPIAAKLLRNLNTTVLGADIHPEAEIAGGCFIGHTHGVTIGPHCLVGRGCLIFHGVTLTAATRPGLELGDKDWLKVGERVCIFTGAVVIGRVTIESDATIGANAVVLRSVPRGATAFGVPAVSIGPLPHAGAPT